MSPHTRLTRRRRTEGIGDYIKGDSTKFLFQEQYIDRRALRAINTVPESACEITSRIEVSPNRSDRVDCPCAVQMTAFDQVFDDLEETWGVLVWEPSFRMNAH